MPKLYVMVGFPRSGKSTHVNKNFKDIVKVSADQLRLLIHGKPFLKEKETFVWKVREIMLKALCEQSLDIVIDETNLTKERRKKSINFSKEYGYETVAIVIPTDKNTCKERAKKTGQDHLIPVIDRMTYEPVENNEGFSKVIVLEQGEVFPM
jgi:predicted kinase